MREKLPYVIAIVGIISMAVGAVFAIIFSVYWIIGFFSWLWTDPLDWIREPAPRVTEIRVEPIDVIRCREEGGYPVLSLWDNRLKRCDKMK